MMTMPTRAAARALLTSIALLAGAATVHAQKPEDFAWRGTLEVPADAPLVRAALPAEALMRLQSPRAADVRVFDASGQPVPFAFAAPPDAPAPQRQPTEAFRALPLFSGQAGAKPPRGSVQVNVQGGDGRSVWVQMSGNGAATDAGNTDAHRLPAALFNTRGSKQTINAVVLKGEVPANTPTRVSLSTSTDLAQWTPVPLRGRWYRFEGPGAPANDTLELQQPLKLEDRYLRLEWHGQPAGVRVESITGLIAPDRPAPPQVQAPLPEPTRDGDKAIEWQLGFATPLAAIELGTPQKNVLVPVRILGRNRPSEPWRLLGQTVVYRLASNGSETTNPAAVLHRPTVRQLRVEATHGATLQGIPITAKAEFDPVELVFVAAGAAPYRVAAGARQQDAQLKPVALPLGMMAGAVEAKMDALPYARWAAAESAPADEPASWARLLPAGMDPRSAALWAVLLAGVIVLGGVAWRLLRNTSNSAT